MFGSIAVGTIGTGGRDFLQMTAKDWRITGYSAAGFLLSLVGMFYFARRGGRDSLQIQSAEWRLRGVTATLAPVSAEDVIAAYLDQFHRERIVFYQDADGVHVRYEHIFDNGTLGDEGELSGTCASQQELLNELGWGELASFEKYMLRIQ